MAAARLDPARYTPFDLHEYEPVRVLGHGGFGVTVLCREVNTGRDVAVKVLLEDELARGINDVLEEGRILTKLRHPNVVELRTVRFADPARKARPYFVMEYLDGFATLADHVRTHGPLQPRDMAVIAPQIAAGLEAAHGSGARDGGGGGGGQSGRLHRRKQRPLWLHQRLLAVPSYSVRRVVEAVEGT